MRSYEVGIWEAVYFFVASSDFLRLSVLLKAAQTSKQLVGNREAAGK